MSPSGMSTIAVPITFLTAIFSSPTSLLQQLLDGYVQISCDLLENLVFPWYTPLISTATLK